MDWTSTDKSVIQHMSSFASDLKFVASGGFQICFSFQVYDQYDSNQSYMSVAPRDMQEISIVLFYWVPVYRHIWHRLGGGGSYYIVSFYLLTIDE